MLNHSIVKSLKAGLPIMKSSFYCYSCVLHIVFMLTEQNNLLVGGRQIPTFFLPGHVKWVRRKNWEKQKKSFVLAAAGHLLVFPGGYKQLSRVENVALSQGNVVCVSMPIILAYAEKAVSKMLDWTQICSEELALVWRDRWRNYLTCALSFDGLQSAFATHTYSLWSS